MSQAVIDRKVALLAVPSLSTQSAIEASLKPATRNRKGIPEDPFRYEFDLFSSRSCAQAKRVRADDAAVVEKDAEGKVHVHKHEKPTQRGAWTGIAVGAVVGILFPPSVIASAAVGGVAGGVIGHLWHGMSRGDMKDLGETLDAGTAALVVVGREKLSEKIEKATAHAQKKTEKQAKVDEKDFEKELESASKEAK